jgi:biopolymer transport protein ExbB/biopolymer transport protein TolQ
MEFDPRHLGPVAIGVMVVLLAMSVASIGLIVERWWSCRLAVRQSRRCASDVAQLLRAGRVEDAIAASTNPSVTRSHLAALFAAGLREWTEARQHTSDPEVALAATRDALEQAASLCLAEFRRGLGLLGTIGSTAPFVGLFGTTFGIINAFKGITLTGSAQLTAISAGIAEALVTTAFGLFVAVPAVWAYNAFLGRIEAFRVELDRSAYQLLRHLARS